MAYWQGKRIAITGSSAGFGLVLAEQFAHAGARVAIIGRTTDSNLKAKQSLSSGNGLHLAVDMDMQELKSVQTGVEQIVSVFGGLDVWVNNVGKSTRISALDTPAETYRDFLETNLMTAIHGTTAALPWLEKTAGSLVNIGSLSSKIAWPFMAPYTVSKFALAGYTEQIRLEAAKRAHVLLVCPGPMERSDSGNRYDDQMSIPESARQPGAGAPVKLLSPVNVARQVMSACEKRRNEIVIPGKVRWLSGLLQLFPNWGHRILRRKSGLDAKADAGLRNG